MGVASGCGEQEVGVVSGSGWNLWVCKVQSMDDNCGEWVECMGVASGYGEQEVGVASRSGWNVWVWLLGVVLRRYIYLCHLAWVDQRPLYCKE